MSLNTHLLFCVRRNFHQITQRKSTLKSAPIILPALWSPHQRGSSFLVNGEYHHSDICNNNLIIGISISISALLVQPHHRPQHQDQHHHLQHHRHQHRHHDQHQPSVPASRSLLRSQDTPSPSPYHHPISLLWQTGT